MIVPTERVLLVDDDPNVLKAYERRLRRKFDVETALCSEEGVTAVNFLGPFAVIVSDMAMPREDGADFLARMHDLSPDSVRIMLTGNADQATAVRAVNQAKVFRFLNKPCQADELEAAIQEGIEEHRRLVAERDLMSQTVHGVVAMLTRVLSLTSPTAFGRANRLKSLAVEVAEAAEINDAWRLEIAAALSQLGAVTLTEATLARVAQDEELSPEEREQVAGQFAVAAGLIGEAPRLEETARVVALQGEPAQENEAAGVVRLAELLRVTLAFDHLVGDLGLARADALHRMKADPDTFDAAALDAVAKVVAKHDARSPIEVSVGELVDGMLLIEDVVTTDDRVLVAKGHDVTPSLRSRLQNYADSDGLRQPLHALATADTIAEIEEARAAAAV